MKFTRKEFVASAAAFAVSPLLAADGEFVGPDLVKTSFFTRELLNICK